MREYVEKTLHTRVDCEPVDASGLPLYLRGLYSLERWTAFGVPFGRGLPRRKPDGEDHGEAPRRPGGGPGDPCVLRPRGRHGLQGRADARGGPALHRPGQAGVPAVPGNRAEQRAEPRARQAADRRWRVLAPDAAPRAHGALRRPRRRQRHPGGRPPRRGEDDRLSRIRRARGRRPLDRRHRGAAAGAAPRQGQDGDVASLGAAHV